MIKISDATVEITEQTLRELLKAVEDTKKETTFTNDPIPGGDMNLETYREFKKKRGEILVESRYSPIKFLISLETAKNTQESLGYRLN